MTTNIIPHVPLSPDHRIEVIIGFGADVPADADWPDPLDLFARFVAAGGFVESCPQLNWKATVLPHGLHVTYERLPADPSVLAVLVRMFLALALPPTTIQVQGTPAASGARSLPSTPAALELVPNVRPQLAFGLEMEPGLSWLCIEVSCSTTLEPAAAQLIDERLELWCKVCRAGGLSEVGADQAVEPGQAGKYEPSVG
ncbi:MAG: hypothetical protein KC501_25260, partial [Myxococcales bacterium]|nr:hypothetical protein [Myxococcales bacterium]